MKIKGRTEDFIDESFCRSVNSNEINILKETVSWLDRYFSGEKTVPNELNLAPIGGEFRRKVWKILCEIPFGETETYGNIAKKVAFLSGKEKMSAQAIGGAVRKNPISIIIPCHRVIGAGKKLVGYGGGLDLKIKLLKHENGNFSFR